MFAAILGPVAGLAKTWIEGKQKKAQLKSQVELTKLEATKQKIKQDGTWEEKAMSASDSSWKDEAWTILFIVIIAMCFIPFTQPFVERGFVALDATPDWFQYAVYASIAASFGLRGLKGIKK